MQKYEQAARLLTARVRQGDYRLNPFPSERRLAEELGVSYMTARRAIKVLVDERTLLRQQNGRLAVNPHATIQASVAQFALLFLVGSSFNNTQLATEIERAATLAGCVMRPVMFAHWDDPIILDAVEGFDGAFVLTTGSPFRPSIRLFRKLKASTHKVVVVDNNWTDEGFVSVDPFPVGGIPVLLDYFASLGHLKIDCFHVQPLNDIGRERIQAWARWQEQHGGIGELMQSPSTMNNVYPPGYSYITERLNTGYRPEAIMGTSIAASILATRALVDCGVWPGRDASVGVVNGEGLAQFLVPALTAIEAPELTTVFVRLMRWMQAGGQFNGPLLVEPGVPPLVVRDSTVKPKGV